MGMQAAQHLESLRVYKASPAWRRELASAAGGKESLVLWEAEFGCSLAHWEKGCRGGPVFQVTLYLGNIGHSGWAKLLLALSFLKE